MIFPAVRRAQFRADDLPDLIDRIMDVQERGVAAAGEIHHALAEMNTRIAVLSERLESHATQTNNSISEAREKQEAVEERMLLMERIVSKFPTQEILDKETEKIKRMIFDNQRTNSKALKSLEKFRWQSSAVIGAFVFLMTIWGDDISHFLHQAAPIPHVPSTKTIMPQSGVRAAAYRPSVVFRHLLVLLSPGEEPGNDEPDDAA